MSVKKYLDDNGLLYYDNKQKSRLNKKVDKEFKTGSESQYKVLSDNNLTDELLQKINNAGTSKFNGDYFSLTNKPAIDGNELSSTSTAEDLGLAKKTDIPTDYVSNTELDKKGYQNASDVNSTINSKGYATETFVTQKIAQLNKKEVVTSTEDMTNENTIYLLANKGSESNSYDEYIVYDGKPEKIGTTDVDLTGYLKEESLIAITNAEIDGLLETE